MLIDLETLKECHDCGHHYDSTDKRASEQFKLCPACNITGHAMKGWAVWNDCQGVFPCGVRDRKFVAQALIDQGKYTPDETVVPVCIIPESGMEEWRRQFHEGGKNP